MSSILLASTSCLTIPLSKFSYLIFQTKLFPTIYLFWQNYQRTLFDEIKLSNSKIVISGDGRHDSMGHSAKYGAYSIFCNTHPAVIHFEMVQVSTADIVDIFLCIY